MIAIQSLLLLKDFPFLRFYGGSSLLETFLTPHTPQHMLVSFFTFSVLVGQIDLTWNKKDIEEKKIGKHKSSRGGKRTVGKGKGHVFIISSGLDLISFGSIKILHLHESCPIEMNMEGLPPARVVARPDARPVISKEYIYPNWQKWKRVEKDNDQYRYSPKSN